MNPADEIPQVQARALVLFQSHREEILRRTDRWFAHLMMFQFVGGVAAALIISPRTWSGPMSEVHLHVWAALLVGGAIASLPVTLAFLLPGRLITRMVIACAQMLTSALLIHLTGGRIETHFHVFGSLAFLAFYRDWRVFIPATVVVALDHLLRGMFWPESVYGVIAATPWRTMEHAAWVIFEEIFLIRSCLMSIREMKEIAARRAQLEWTNTAIEATVRQRTAELADKHTALQDEMAERQAAQAAREAMQQRLLEVSRAAGMADVATGVLHNVGNVLNSVNVAATTVSDRLKKSPASDVAAVAGLLAGQDDLAEFLTRDEKGRLIPEYLGQLGQFLLDEHAAVVGELDVLNQNIGHIRDIVSLQQSYARVAGAAETLRLEDVIEDAMRINLAGLQRHRVTIVRDYQENLPAATVERQKVLQILVNLVSNAKYAVDECQGERRVIVRVARRPDDPGRVQIAVIDNGMGIPRENLTSIFSMGFTTRREGHGFGLHSSALTARELGGSIMASSDGPGHGATFVLEIPLTPLEAVV